MAELKTKVNDASVDAFLAGIEDDDQRAFAERIAELMAEASGAPAKMWGANIVGFGTYTYRYASGRTGDWMRVAFSPRKAAMSIYIMPNLDAFEAILARLGTYKTGKSCLYVKRASDVDMGVLRELIDSSLAAMRELYPESAGRARAAEKKKPSKKKAAKKKAAKKK